MGTAESNLLSEVAEANASKRDVLGRVFDERHEGRQRGSHGDLDRVVDGGEEVDEVGETAFQLAQERDGSDEDRADLVPLR